MYKMSKLIFFILIVSMFSCNKKVEKTDVVVTKVFSEGILHEMWHETDHSYSEVEHIEGVNDFGYHTIFEVKYEIKDAEDYVFVVLGFIDGHDAILKFYVSEEIYLKYHVGDKIKIDPSWPLEDPTYQKIKLD